VSGSAGFTDVEVSWWASWECGSCGAHGEEGPYESGDEDFEVDHTCGQEPGK